MVLDLLIVLFVLLVVVRGARTGLLAGVFSLVGVVVGASVGSRGAPYLLPDGGDPLFGAGIKLRGIPALAGRGVGVARAPRGGGRNPLTSSTGQDTCGL